MKIVDISLEQGTQYFATIDGEKFFVGRRTAYDGGKGLANLRGTPEQRYDRAAYRATHGFWADFIHPTATVESNGLFHALNTYDRARCTFTFLQFAAHVPDGDFVRFLRALLALPLAAEYFPDLRLANGRVARATDAGVVPLESDASTEPLMAYFNPSRQEVEDTEVIQAAKLVHWADHDPAHRRTQVDVGVALFREKMLDYAKRYALDGARDDVCLVVSDIRHQGRAKSVEIVAALARPDPLAALLDVGEPAYHGRLVELRAEVKRLTDDGTLGGRVYSLAARDFVPR